MFSWPSYQSTRTPSLSLEQEIRRNRIRKPAFVSLRCETPAHCGTRRGERATPCFSGCERISKRENARECERNKKRKQQKTRGKGPWRKAANGNGRHKKGARGVKGRARRSSRSERASKRIRRRALVLAVQRAETASSLA